MLLNLSPNKYLLQTVRVLSEKLAHTRCRATPPRLQPKNTFRGAIMPDEIEVEAVLEECRALIKQIVADLSGEKPFADETSATELLSYLERAASALKKSVSRS